MLCLYKENVRINRRFAIIFAMVVGLSFFIFSDAPWLFGSTNVFKMTSSAVVETVIEITLCLLILFNLNAWFRICDSSIERGYIFWRKRFLLGPNMKVYVGELEIPRYGWVKYNAQSTDRAEHLLSHPMIFIASSFRLKHITGVIIEDGARLYSLPTDQPEKVKGILDAQIAKLQPNPQF